MELQQLNELMLEICDVLDPERKYERPTLSETSPNLYDMMFAAGAYLPGRNWVFINPLTRYYSIEDTTRILAHECRHWQQYQSGALVVIGDGGDWSGVWQGQLWTGTDYELFPWEQDANQFADEYVAQRKAREAA